MCQDVGDYCPDVLIFPDSGDAELEFKQDEGGRFVTSAKLVFDGSKLLFKDETAAARWELDTSSSGTLTIHGLVNLSTDDGDDADGEFRSTGTIKVTNGGTGNDLAWFNQGPTPLTARIRMTEHGELVWLVEMDEPPTTIGKSQDTEPKLLSLLDANSNAILEFRLDVYDNPLLRLHRAYDSTKVWDIKSGVGQSAGSRAKLVIHNTTDDEDRFFLTYDANRDEADLQVTGTVTPGEFLVTGESGSPPNPDGVGCLYLDSSANPKRLLVSFSDGQGGYEWRMIELS